MQLQMQKKKINYNQKEYVKQRNEVKGVFGAKRKRDAITVEINILEGKINNVNNKIQKYEDDLKKATDAGKSNNSNKIDAIDKKANLRISDLNKQISDLENNQLKPMIQNKNLTDSLNQEEKETT